MSYSYWETFFRDWAAGTKAINGWSNPDLVPLYNNNSSKDPSSNYVPEPWWGNDGTQPLHSVVINFNPGSGSPVQHTNSVKTKGFTSYAALVNSGFLPKTTAWHFNNRAKPVLTVLNGLGCISQSAVTLQSHLSIELIPWHTESTDKIKNPGYNVYCQQNLKQIFDCSIRFAADQSRRIENDKLRNKVIVRVSANRMQELLNGFESIGHYSKVITPTTNCGNGRYMEFKFNSLPDVKFICIWGPSSRNNFPSRNDLKQIISQI